SDLHGGLSGRIRIVIDHRVGFDLNQPVPIDEARNLNYGAYWPYAAEILTVDTSHQRPVLNAREQNPRPHHVAPRCACTLESCRDDLEAAPRLRSGVATADSVAVGSKRCGTRDGYDRTGTHRPRKADFRLIRAAARDEFAHGLLQVHCQSTSS